MDPADRGARPARRRERGAGDPGQRGPVTPATPGGPREAGLALAAGPMASCRFRGSLSAMATPTLTAHTLPGVLGPLLVDVRTSDRAEPRPAVLIVHGFKGFKDWGMFPPLADRVARAGFTAVSFNLSGSGVDEKG